MSSSWSVVSACMIQTHLDRRLVQVPLMPAHRGVPQTKAHTMNPDMVLSGCKALHRLPLGVLNAGAMSAKDIHLSPHQMAGRDICESTK